jgi:hypothetical protein
MPSPGRYAPLTNSSTLNFRQLISKYVTGNMATEQLPDIAIKGLEENLDTPSLCILAGLNQPENFYLIDHYFKLTLEELNLKLPDKRQAAIEYSLAIVDEILDGQKNIIYGTYEIYNKALGSYNFDSEFKRYRYDSINFAKAYGLYWTYDDLSNSDYPWQAGKTNEQLMEEVKEELFAELKVFKETNMKGA